MTKIREALSDDKHDWEHRVVAVSDAPISLLLLIDTVTFKVFVFLLSLAEESTLTAPGWSRRTRGLPPTAPTYGRCLQALCKRLALPGGPGGLHHPWV